MTASARKGKSLFATTSNSFSTGEGVTITPNDVAGLPTGEIVLTFDREVAGKIERILGSVSGSNFVVSSGGRGYDGTTEQSHTSPAVEYVYNGADQNDFVDAFVAEHSTAGVHDDTKIATLTSTQTLTNKTLTSPRLDGAINKPTVTAVSGATPNLDLDVNNQFSLTLSEAAAISVSNEDAGQCFLLQITQDAGANEYAVTWMDTVHWVDGTAPTLSTGASEVDLFGFRVTGTDTYQGYVIGQAVAAVA